MFRNAKYLLPISLALGLAGGVGFYLVTYARAASYLSDDPAACANCHVMQPQYDGWLASSHKNVAGCNDCHTPPEFFPKYGTKALNGWFHSYAFTTGDFAEPIRINDRNRRVTESACRNCHMPLVEEIDRGEQEQCLRCHATVGHL